MTKIGFNVLAWAAGLPDKLLPVTEKLKTIGYDGVEFAIDDQRTAVYKRFGEHLANIGLESTCVMVLGPDENPVSESAAIRDKALDRIRQAIDRSQALNSKIICGPIHSAFATFTRRAPVEEEYKRSAEVLHAAGEYAAQAGIMLLPEALNRFECYLCNTMETLLGLIKRVDHPNVKAMFDTHHANMEEKKFKTAIETIAPVLAHVHISENDRGTPGDGHILFDEVFATLAAIQYNAINVWREYSRPWEMAENGLRFIKEMRTKHGLQ
jgi:D-psicose/D-tagatose/L-ribulose 3-epimerase